MKQVRRIILNGLTVLSLLLCIATVVLWVRSYPFHLLAFGENHALFAARGWLSLDHSTPRQRLLKALHTRVEPSSFQNLVWPPRPRPPARRSLTRQWSANVPLGGLLALMAALPSLRLVSYRQRKLIERRKDCGLCVSCGYDLRATPERCPECGAIPSKVKA